MSGVAVAFRILSASRSVSSLALSRSHPRPIYVLVTTLDAIAGPQSGTGSSTASATGLWLTFTATLIAAAVSGLSIYFIRKTGRDTANAAERSAEAAMRSAAATEESAKAAIKSAEAAYHSAASSDHAARTAAARANQESLLSRYRSASEQLDYSHSATVRLAGAYAMSHLADDWPEQRQMCVDVLCAYLRMPDATAIGESQVRTSIIRLIDAHLTQVKRRRFPDEISWSPMSFEFSSAHFADLRLEAPVFNNNVSFSGATFTGRCQIWGPTFKKWVDFSDATIEGSLDLPRVSLGANFLFNRPRLLAQSSLSIGQSWTVGNLSQIIGEDLEIEGHFELSVHPDEAGLNVHLDRLQAKPGSRVVIKSHSSGESEAPRWFHPTAWVVHPKAQIWLPADAERLDEPWFNTSAARSGAVKFGDPPASRS